MSLQLKDDKIDEVSPDINMTPLIDIMLVLLIIFMVTSSISLESGLDIDLPETKSKTTPQESDAVLVSLDEKGEVSIQGKKVIFEKVEESIRGALGDSKSSMVVLEGDRTSNLGRAIQIMDFAKAAGAKKFAIAAEQSRD